MRLTALEPNHCEFVSSMLQLLMWPGSQLRLADVATSQEEASSKTLPESQTTEEVEEAAESYHLAAEGSLQTAGAAEAGGAQKACRHQKQVEAAAALLIVSVVLVPSQNLPLLALRRH